MSGIIVLGMLFNDTGSHLTIIWAIKVFFVSFFHFIWLYLIALFLFIIPITVIYNLIKEVKIPNARTKKAIKDSIQGKNQKRFDSTDELFEDLGND